MYNAGKRLAGTDAEVLRVVVYGGPLQAEFVADGSVVQLHVSELEAIIEDAVESDDVDALWHFIDDLATFQRLASTCAAER